MKIVEPYGSSRYSPSIGTNKAVETAAQNPYTFSGKIVDSTLNMNEPAPAASSTSLQHPDVERRLKEAGWDFGSLDYNQFGGIPLIIPPDAVITKEGISLPAWYAEEMRKYMGSISGEEKSSAQTDDAVEEALKSGKQYVEVLSDTPAVNYKERLPRIFSAELQLYDTLKEKTGYDYPGLKDYLEYRKNLIEIL